MPELTPPNTNTNGLFSYFINIEISTTKYFTYCLFGFRSFPTFRMHFGIVENSINTSMAHLMHLHHFSRSKMSEDSGTDNVKCLLLVLFLVQDCINLLERLILLKTESLNYCILYLLWCLNVCTC